jgi:hypothetical protein
MAHLPNKLRKEQRDEADRQRRLHSGSATDRTPPNTPLPPSGSPMRLRISMRQRIGMMFTG